MLSNINLTTKAILAVSIFGFSVTSIAVALGNLPSPFASLASVSVLPAKVCYTTSEIELLEKEKINLESGPAGKVALAEQLKVAEQEKKDISAILAASTTAMSALKLKLPAAATITSAERALDTTKAQVALLAKKATLTSAEKKKLEGLMTKQSDQQVALDRLKEILPEYQQKTAAFAARKTELENSILIATQRIASIKDNQKTNVADLAQITKNIAAAKPKKCKPAPIVATATSTLAMSTSTPTEAICLTKNDTASTTLYASMVKSIPTKIKTLTDEIPKAKLDLPKADAEVKAAAEVVKLATPTAIGSAKKKYDDLVAAYKKATTSAQRRTISAQRGVAEDEYLKLKNAEEMHRRAVYTQTKLKNIIANNPGEIKKLSDQLAFIKTEIVRLQQKKTISKGVLCQITAIGSGSTGGSVADPNKKIDPSLGGKNGGKTGGSNGAVAEPLVCPDDSEGNKVTPYMCPNGNEVCDIAECSKTDYDVCLNNIASDLALAEQRRALMMERDDLLADIAEYESIQNQNCSSGSSEAFDCASIGNSIASGYQRLLTVEAKLAALKDYHERICSSQARISI